MKTLWLALFVVSQISIAQGEGAYFATGFKIGEVTDREAIVWTRLTRNEKRIDFEAPFGQFLSELSFQSLPMGNLSV